MKNKTKLNKIRENTGRKNAGEKAADKPKAKATGRAQNFACGEWLYLLEREIGVSDLKAALADEYSVQVWNEAGVFEIEFEEDTVDFETAQIDSEDEFIKNNGIRTVFLVSFKPSVWGEALKAMKMLKSKLGGSFVTDNEAMEELKQ